MKILLGLFSLVLLACALPSAAQAQCSSGCTRLLKENGEVAGYGCVTIENSGVNCIATATKCTASRCMNAFITTPEGRVVGQRDGCVEAPAAASLAAAVEATRERLSVVFVHHLRMATVLSGPARRVGE
jgi:hypothetical protein